MKQALALVQRIPRAFSLQLFRRQNPESLAGIVLGIGRAIGETMAVIMIAGNQPRMPKGITEGLRTMTANIVLEMGYASDFTGKRCATGVVLFVFILLINLSVSMLNRRVHYGD